MHWMWMETIHSTSTPLSNPTELDAQPCRVTTYDRKHSQASLTLILLLLIFPTGISIAFRGQNELGMVFQLSGLHAELGEVRVVLKAALSLLKMRKQGVSTPN